jgi:hypothetical protein
VGNQAVVANNDFSFMDINLCTKTDHGVPADLNTSHAVLNGFQPSQCIANVTYSQTENTAHKPALRLMTSL